MIAVKEKIASMEQEIATFKAERGINEDDEMLPETYLKLRYPGDPETQGIET